jgi:Flp pilus assembly pilin Flp
MNTYSTGERGAALLEYVLLLGLIAVLGIAGLRSAGPAVSSAFDDAGRALGDQSASVVDSPADGPTPIGSSAGREFPGGGYAGGGKGKK